MQPVISHFLGILHSALQRASVVLIIIINNTNQQYKMDISIAEITTNKLYDNSTY